MATTGIFFPRNLRAGEYTTFPAAGFGAPAAGVIYRKDNAVRCGMPLGGFNTGFVDLDTSGLFGLCSMFNSHVPRRGAMNLPPLGLHADGRCRALHTPGRCG